MSVRIMSQVWELDLGHSEIAVMLALSDHADDDGKRCFPSVPYIAWKTGYSPRQVQRLMSQLQRKGLIEPVAYETGGRGRATEYHIHIENGGKKPPYVPPERVTSTTRKGDIHDIKGDTMTPFDSERVTSTTRKGDIHDIKGDIHDIKGDIAMSPQPSGTISKPSCEPPTVSRLDRKSDKNGPPSSDLPQWFRSLTDLEGFVDRNYNRTIQIIETACGKAEVSAATVAKAFAEYWPEGKIRFGWSDPAAALRNGRVLGIEISKAVRIRDGPGRNGGRRSLRPTREQDLVTDPDKHAEGWE